ncbi:MAG: type I restriction enzyme HsdR N-terminal domain-containing protein [Candidatus Omnitrophica bacterium]|nr:type I restriction enzyme HsdR N-terminal domain-containing protein [Candidatus Omnitrophota bacterium]MCM8803371.1 type I restriction enzyme HsdR N-terminal domain-containing protein [Candidatus Omnitrophota bacterium]
MMKIKQEIERIAKLKEEEIGPTEENIKQKIMVPILELLGHKRENLEFEYRTRTGGKIDIYIKNVPSDCKVIIDTKNYNENLNDYIEQIKNYTFDEGALLTVIANGTEIRIYSPLRGVSFERSLLYSFKRQDLSKDAIWNLFSDLLHIDNLQNRNVLKKIDEREREIKNVMLKEEEVKHEYNSKIEGIDYEIETKEEEIKNLKKEKELLAKELKNKISEIWDAVGLPTDLFRSITSFEKTSIVVSPLESEKARKVTLQELVDAGLVRDGQILYFFHRGRGVFKDEQAEIVANQNKLRYKGDGKLYSISELAKKIDIKLGFKRDEHGVAGPNYWQTEDGRLLHDLNEIVRQRQK